ncbi:btb (poz) domain-containing 2a-related [Anaeramoeba flamelloides]|uniref:Btb (Poz) domain-containing 2a-related n=1 Tax=Anaeramoeba flamelloides TaxID=1746091 RepID=A0ABQ8YLK7_9EUKA|nr:btb (poz) domain-containing 2a-related [Anaeramoeba flamelloides]
MDINTIDQDLINLSNKKGLSDVHFLVGKEKTKFYSHKTILSINSKHFLYRFYLFPNKKNAKRIPIVIEEPNISKESFQIFLNFFYTKKAQLSDQVLWEVIRLCSKYQVPGLLEMCCKFLEQTLNDNNLFQELDKALTLNEPLIISMVCKKIEKRSAIFFETKGFLNDLPSKICKIILSLDSLEAQEIDIIYRVIERGEHVCQEMNLPINSQNIKKQIIDLIPLIQLDVLEPNQLTKILEFQIFNSTQILDLIINKLSQPNNQLTQPNTNMENYSTFSNLNTQENNPNQKNNNNNDLGNNASQDNQKGNLNVNGNGNDNDNKGGEGNNDGNENENENEKKNVKGNNNNSNSLNNNCISIAILAHDSFKKWRRDVLNSIKMNLEIKNQIKIFDTTKRIPLIEELSSFKIVFQYGNQSYTYKQRQKIGDLLSKCLRLKISCIISTCFFNSEKTRLEGKISMFNNWPNFEDSILINNKSNLDLKKKITSNPKINTEFFGGNRSYRLKNVKDPGRILAKWETGEFFISQLRYKQSKSSIILLNFFPVSNNVFKNFNDEFSNINSSNYFHQGGGKIIASIINFLIKK